MYQKGALIYIPTISPRHMPCSFQLLLTASYCYRYLLSKWWVLCVLRWKGRSRAPPSIHPRSCHCHDQKQHCHLKIRMHTGYPYMMHKRSQRKDEMFNGLETIERQTVVYVPNIWKQHALKFNELGYWIHRALELSNGWLVSWCMILECINMVL